MTSTLDRGVLLGKLLGIKNPIFIVVPHLPDIYRGHGIVACFIGGGLALVPDKPGLTLEAAWAEAVNTLANQKKAPQIKLEELVKAVGPRPRLTKSKRRPNKLQVQHVDAKANKKRQAILKAKKSKLKTIPRVEWTSRIQAVSRGGKS